MSQTSYIAAFLIVGFIVFITMRGELRDYLDVLGIDMSSSSMMDKQVGGSAPKGTTYRDIFGPDKVY